MEFENFEILRRKDDFHLFSDFTFLNQDPHPKGNFWNYI